MAGAMVFGPGRPDCCFASWFNAALPCPLPPTSQALPRFCCGRRSLVADHRLVFCSRPQRPRGPAALAPLWRSPLTPPFPRTTCPQCSPPDAFALLLPAGSHKREQSLWAPAGPEHFSRPTVSPCQPDSRGPPPDPRGESPC